MLHAIERIIKKEKLNAKMEVKIQVACEMLKEGYSIDKISRITKLSIDKIKKIENFSE